MFNKKILIVVAFLTLFVTSCGTVQNNLTGFSNNPGQTNYVL